MSFNDRRRKAIGGTATGSGLNIKIQGGDVTEYPVTVENVTNFDTDSGSQDHDDAAKVYRFDLFGHLWASGFVPAFGGQFVAEDFGMDLHSGQVRKEWPVVMVSNAPSSNSGLGDGCVRFDYGRPVYSAGLRGWNTRDTFFDGNINHQGTLTVQAGTSADKISGNAIFRRTQVSPDQRQGRPIGLSGTAIWRATPTITAGPIGIFSVDALLTSLAIDIGSGSNKQALTGCAILEYIVTTFDRSTEEDIKVRIGGYWNEDPAAA